VASRVFAGVGLRSRAVAVVVTCGAVVLTGAVNAQAADRGHRGGIEGDRHFVDCAHGNDSASGLSPHRAWRSLAKVNSVVFGPGDAILFRRGTRCAGVLEPRGSGAPREPIVVDAYGWGRKPELAGGGERATVYLHDVDAWELHNLDVSDLGPPPRPGEKRTAIWVVLDSLGTGHHYVMKDIDVHDVNTSAVLPPEGGSFENYSKDSGGIIFSASHRDQFDDVLIARNTFEDVVREGIFIQGGSPTTRLRIRDNRLLRIGGDGIVAVSSTGALIERNTVDDFNMVGTSFNAGVWAYASTDAVFQFNDVSHGENSPLDGMAYDIDGGNHHLVFQYNLSHDNDGGFLMLCNDLGGDAPNGGSVVRYNISQNDYANGRGVIDAPYLCGAENDISIYNNTIYAKDPRATLLLENTAGSTIHLTNNLLIGPGPNSLIIDETGTWEHNLYLDVTCAARPPDSGALIADPLLAAPGTATSLTRARGYRLRRGSPALGAGIPIPDDGRRDYFGGPIPRNGSPNIGAYQGPGVGPQAPAGTAPATAPGC
jgi:Right handed beta helix region